MRDWRSLGQQIGGAGLLFLPVAGLAYAIFFSGDTVGKVNPRDRAAMLQEEAAQKSFVQSQQFWIEEIEHRRATFSEAACEFEQGGAWNADRSNCDLHAFDATELKKAVGS